MLFWVQRTKKVTSLMLHVDAAVTAEFPGLGLGFRVFTFLCVAKCIAWTQNQKSKTSICLHQLKIVLVKKPSRPARTDIQRKHKTNTTPRIVVFSTSFLMQCKKHCRECGKLKQNLLNLRKRSTMSRLLRTQNGPTNKKEAQPNPLHDGCQQNTMLFQFNKEPMQEQSLLL